MSTPVQRHASLRAALAAAFGVDAERLVRPRLRGDERARLVAAYLLRQRDLNDAEIAEALFFRRPRHARAAADEGARLVAEKADCRMRYEAAAASLHLETSAAQGRGHA